MLKYVPQRVKIHEASKTLKLINDLLNQLKPKPADNKERVVPAAPSVAALASGYRAQLHAQIRDDKASGQSHQAVGEPAATVASSQSSSAPEYSQVSSLPNKGKF